MPIKVPNYNSFCITHFEAEKVYKCVESDQIVSPLVFHKDFQPPVESVRPEYQSKKLFFFAARADDRTSNNAILRAPNGI